MLLGMNTFKVSLIPSLMNWIQSLTPAMFSLFGNCALKRVGRAGIGAHGGRSGDKELGSVSAASGLSFPRPPHPPPRGVVFKLLTSLQEP